MVKTTKQAEKELQAQVKVLDYKSLDDMLHDLYERRGISLKRLSRLLRVNPHLLENVLKDHGFRIRGLGLKTAAMRSAAAADERYRKRAVELGYESEYEMLVDLFARQKVLIRDIAEVLGISGRTVSHRLSKYRLNDSQAAAERENAHVVATARRWDQIAKSLGFRSEREMLECLYRDQSLRSIGVLLGVDANTVKTRMERHRIPRRSQGGYHVSRSVKKQEAIVKRHKDCRAWNRTFDDFDSTTQERWVG